MYMLELTVVKIDNERYLDISDEFLTITEKYANIQLSRISSQNKIYGYNPATAQFLRQTFCCLNLVRDAHVINEIIAKIHKRSDFAKDRI